MAKTWYPVIDYAFCTDCGVCISKCSNGVFDVAKAPAPVVIKPDACINRCHGCGNRCPEGAITYVGDDTGWTPPQGEKKEQDAGNCCGLEADNKSGCSCGGNC